MVDVCGCTKQDCKGWLCINVFCIILGFPIWAGLYFSVYDPYLTRDWEDAQCTIIDVQTYITLHTAWQVYIQYKAVLTIDNKVYPGYGCESTASIYRPDDSTVDNAYPYLYTDCKEHHRGGDQCPEGLVFFPKWLCMPYQGTPAFSIGDEVECKWWFNGVSAGPEDVEQLSYPVFGEEYIELLFTDEIYIPTGDYYALWVIPFGLMSALPFVMLTCWVGPSFYGYCDQEKIDRIKDFFDIYIKCKRVIPRNFLRLPTPSLGDKSTALTPWLFGYEYSVSKKRKINEPMLKEICEYISGSYINPY